MITQEDIDAFAYWEKSEVEHKTPMDYVREYQKATDQKPDARLYKILIREEYKEWLEALMYGPLNSEGDVAELKELADLLYVMYGYANAKGWNLDEAVKRVHENNMGRMYQPDGTIKRREDGKIIKNPEFPKVNLSDLI